MEPGKKDRKGGKELLFLSLATIFVIAVLHFWALENFLYWVYWWFDILMHLLGSFWVAIMAIWLYLFSGLSKTLISKRRLLLISFVSVVFVGLFWEIFKLISWQTHQDPNFIFDTTVDVIMNLVGAFVAYRYSVYNFLETKLDG